MIQEKLRRIKNFPPELAMLLKHMVVSHHGDRNFGSPEPPKTMEAILLNYVDELDSKLRGIHDFIAADESEESWTAYHGIHGRHFFKGSFRQPPETRSDPASSPDSDEGQPKQKSIF
jgi:3'-5' exoribonuclease